MEIQKGKETQIKDIGDIPGISKSPYLSTQKSSSQAEGLGESKMRQIFPRRAFLKKYHPIHARFSLLL